MDGTTIGRRQVFVGTGAALAAGTLASVAWPAAAHADEDDDRDGDDRGVIGTWLVDAVLDSGEPAGQALASFIPGGVLVVIDGSLQDPAPPQAGQWKKRRDHGFAGTFMTFLYDNNPSNPSVNRIGTLKLVIEGSTGHGKISGRFRITVTIEGDPPFEDVGSFSGGRVEVEAL
jgi:hypothetical protein